MLLELVPAFIFDPNNCMYLFIINFGGCGGIMYKNRKQASSFFEAEEEKTFFFSKTLFTVVTPKPAKYQIIIDLIPYKATKWQISCFSHSTFTFPSDSELCEKSSRAGTCTVQPVIVTSPRRSFLTHSLQLICFLK